MAKSQAFLQAHPPATHSYALLGKLSDVAKQCFFLAASGSRGRD